MSIPYDKSDYPDIPISEVIALIPMIAVEMTSEVPNRYHDLECCEWTRGIDTLLSRYAQDREEITDLIMNDPDELIATIWKQDGILAIDNTCRCRMGCGDKRSPFACAQCKNLRRLIDFRLGGVERPFRIECGDSVGKNFIVSSTNITSPFLAYDDESTRRAKLFVQQYQYLTSCGTPDIHDMECVTGDSFTIRTLVLWMIAKMFAEKNLPHIPSLLTVFICSGVGYSLYDMPTIGTVSELHKIEAYHNKTTLKSEIARTIIIQLLVTLLELSNVNFSHGTPSIHGLIFNKEPVSYSYDGVHVTGPITLQITDLWNSSATFNDYHYFPKNTTSSMCIERNMFVPEITTKTISMAHCYDIGNTPCSGDGPCPDSTVYDVCKQRNVVIYRLTNSTLDIYNAIRHIGFPLYSNSFDFYCFMVSLMCDKSFFDAMNDDPKLYRLWSMMWLIEDLPNVEHLIREAHDIQCGNRAASSMVINIIRGCWLRCDITKFLFSLIKLGW
jgi:hypothetical protein